MPIKDDHLPAEGAGREELRKLYAWSFEDAKAAQDEWDKSGDHSQYAVGPLFRWIAAQQLKDLKTMFDAGDKVALLETISLCALRDLSIPKWCAIAYLKAYRKVIHYKVGSWDDAFGKPNPKGTHLGAKRQKREYMFAVYDRIKQIREIDPSVPIDGHLFETVGKEFGIGGKTLTEQYYYDAKKKFEN